MAKGLNAEQVLNNVNGMITELESVKGTWNSDKRYMRMKYTNGGYQYAFRIGEVFEELSIFDWWNESLSTTQLKQMRSFLKTAIKLGFTGYVCFKVGATGCAHGMWAHKEESEDGYSPKGDCIFHSFRTGDNYWDCCINDEWANKDMNTAQLIAYLNR